MLMTTTMTVGQTVFFADPAERGIIALQPDESCAEGLQIRCQYLWRIVNRINTDQHKMYPLAIITELFPYPPKLAQRYWTIVRAACVPKVE
jgi:hypothetical protein